jgi:hypothetical protein
MRTIVIAAAALAALPFTSMHALADGAWCANYTKGATNCGFHSYAQCLADVSGIGGYCAPNPALQTYNPGYQGWIGDARRGVR